MILRNPKQIMQKVKNYDHVGLAFPYSVLLALVITYCIVGCGTPQQVAYKTLASVGAAEDVSMKAAATALVQMRITPNQYNDIVGKHFLFQMSYITACDAAAGQLDKFAPSDVIQLANDVINLVNQLTQKK